MDDIQFEVTRGKLKGQVLTVHQMCNDWISTSDGKIINPLSTYFTPSEANKVFRLEARGQLGIMFKLYELHKFLEEGRFRRKKL